MSIALRPVGLLDVLSSTPAGPSVAPTEMRQMCLVSMPVCASAVEIWREVRVNTAARRQLGSYERVRCCYPNLAINPELASLRK
jgi:hypothetical protein